MEKEHVQETGHLPLQLREHRPKKSQPQQTNRIFVFSSFSSIDPCSPFSPKPTTTDPKNKMSGGGHNRRAVFLSNSENTAQKTPQPHQTNPVFAFSSFSSIDPCSPFSPKPINKNPLLTDTTKGGGRRTTTDDDRRCVRSGTPGGHLRHPQHAPLTQE